MYRQMHKGTENKTYFIHPHQAAPISHLQQPQQYQKSFDENRAAYPAQVQKQNLAADYHQPTRLQEASGAAIHEHQHFPMTKQSIAQYAHPTQPTNGMEQTAQYFTGIQNASGAANQEHQHFPISQQSIAQYAHPIHPAKRREQTGQYYAADTNLIPMRSPVIQGAYAQPYSAVGSSSVDYQQQNY